MVPFPITFSDLQPRFQGHRVTIILDAIDLLYVQLTRDLSVIAKFLLHMLSEIG